MAVDILLLSAILATSALLLLTVWDIRRYNGKGHLPAGPRPIPLLGNVLDIPRHDVGSAFSTLARKYGASAVTARSIPQSLTTSLIGDIIYFTLLGQPMVVIGSVKAAFDLLDKKSANFSGRPISVVTQLYVAARSQNP